MFLKRKETTGEAFQRLLREKNGDPNFWVPGVTGGGLGQTVRALNSLSDDEIVFIVRESARASDKP